MGAAPEVPAKASKSMPAPASFRLTLTTSLRGGLEPLLRKWDCGIGRLHEYVHILEHTMHTCVYVYTRLYICIPISAYVFYVYIHIHIRICKYVCLYKRICVCTCTHAYICMHQKNKHGSVRLAGACLALTFFRLTKTI